MLKIATAAVLAALAFPAYADTDHSTIMGCYASVHSQCYGDGGAGCSDEVYQDGLDECDSSYGNTDASTLNPNRRPGFLGTGQQIGIGVFVPQRSPQRR